LVREIGFAFSVSVYSKFWLLPPWQNTKRKKLITSEINRDAVQPGTEAEGRAQGKLIMAGLSAGCIAIYCGPIFIFFSGKIPFIGLLISSFQHPCWFVFL